MLNEAERSQAEAYGWIVCRVFDSKTERVTVQVLPAANNAVPVPGHSPRDPSGRSNLIFGDTHKMRSARGPYS